MKTKKKESNKFSKESSLKALAKRPKKFFEMISKGKSNIKELRKAGECSGGLIRKMIWSGIAKMNEDKTISLVKGITQKSLPDVDATPVKIRRAEKAEKKKKAGDRAEKVIKASSAKK